MRGRPGRRNGRRHAVQQYACNSSQAQQWRLRDTSDGRVRVDSRGDTTKTWDVADVTAADGAAADGAAAGKATTSLTINSDDVIGDHLWIWPADHVSGVGWNTNTADTGLVVNGHDVTMYGLFVEHYQKHQTIWNGNGGRTYFYQNEMPYDPPSQAAWMNGSTQGYAAYKVANSVTSHQVYGFGSYCYFNVNPGVTAEHAIETPVNANVRFRSMVTVSLGGTGTIRHVVNDRGGPSDSATDVANLVSYP